MRTNLTCTVCSIWLLKFCLTVRMKQFFCLLLCVWTVTSRASTEGVMEDGNPGAVKDQEEDGCGLEDALPAEENEVFLEGLETNEDEWRQGPLLLGLGCQQMWQGQGCGPEPGSVPRVLDPDNPASLKFWDTISQESIRDPEAENSPNTEDMPPPSVDTITSRDSLNLILPSDVMKLRAKKSVNVSLSNAASPDFHTTSTSSHLVSSSSHPSETTKDIPSVPQIRDPLPNQPRPCPFASVPPSSMTSVRTPQTVRPPYVPVSPPLPTTPWQYPPSSQPVPHMPQTAAPRLQLPQPAPSVSYRPIPMTRKIVTLPSRSSLKRKRFKRVEAKRDKGGCKPRCQSCQCSKPKPKTKLICQEAEPEKRIKKPKPCRRDTYVTKSKQKMETARTIQPSGCNRIKGSRQRTTSKLTPLRKGKPKKMVVYVT